MSTESVLAELPIPLERDLFLRTLIRELAGILEDVVGFDDAAGYISLVGQNIGEWINKLYTGELAVDTLSATQVIDVLLDLKSRIQGDFFVIEQDENKIIMGNTTCPFTDKIVGRPSICMVTSNVFGVIIAENLGYAKVVLQETIARGHKGCRVKIYLKPSPEADTDDGREYFGTARGSH
ncbi:MAG: transcriptional regulator [Deltaproteobacteria bacterium]|nr:transcriptional regulator [Deltaproteobacteria bacterium]